MQRQPVPNAQTPEGFKILQRSMPGHSPLHFTLDATIHASCPSTAQNRPPPSELLLWGRRSIMVLLKILHHLVLWFNSYNLKPWKQRIEQRWSSFYFNSRVGLNFKQNWRCQSLRSKSISLWGVLGLTELLPYTRMCWDLSTVEIMKLKLCSYTEF